MKYLSSYLPYILILGALVLGRCTSASLPKQIPGTLRAACDLYTTAKPDVIKAREYAVAHWNAKVPGSDKDLIPAEVKETLKKLDSYLPELDKAGQLLCAASAGVSTFDGSKKINLDDVPSTVIKAATVAAQLKASGAF